MVHCKFIQIMQLHTKYTHLTIPSTRAVEGESLLRYSIMSKLRSDAVCGSSTKNSVNLHKYTWHTVCENAWCTYIICVHFPTCSLCSLAMTSSQHQWMGSYSKKVWNWDAAPMVQSHWIWSSRKYIYSEISCIYKPLTIYHFKIYFHVLYFFKNLAPLIFLHLLAKNKWTVLYFGNGVFIDFNM